MNTQKLAAIVLVCVLLGALNVPAFAVTHSVDSEVMRRWDNTATISLNLDLDGGNVEWSSRIIGHPGTTSIVATYTLYKLGTSGYYELDS